VSRRPLRRPASAQEIALACQFLCSPQASIISGATLVADGGASALMSRRWHLPNALTLFKDLL
jgi:NAD(P)-dependent dehydrogenase (short-subunit alcohol dehydrogenase family)